MSDGLPSFFTSLMSAGLMESTALSALSTMGCALARSPSHSAFSLPMRSASAPQFSLMTATLALSTSASPWLMVSEAIILFTSCEALSSFTCSSASTFFMASTSSAPLTSFSRPRLMFVSERCSATSLTL